MLKLPGADALKLFNSTGCSKLEDYIIELGENAFEFQKIYEELVMKEKPTKDFSFLILLWELWTECNSLWSITNFLRLSFSDRISRAVLIDAKDKNSKFAWSIIPLDIMEAIGLKKSTEGKINTIEDIVFLFVEREAFKFQKITEGVTKIDNDLKAGLI